MTAGAKLNKLDAARTAYKILMVASPRPSAVCILLCKYCKPLKAVNNNRKHTLIIITFFVANWSNFWQHSSCFGLDSSCISSSPPSCDISDILPNSSVKSKAPFIMDGGHDSTALTPTLKQLRVAHAHYFGAFIWHYVTENKRSSIRQLCCHWWHRKLS